MGFWRNQVRSCRKTRILCVWAWANPRFRPACAASGRTPPNPGAHACDPPPPDTSWAPFSLRGIWGGFATPTPEIPPRSLARAQSARSLGGRRKEFSFSTAAAARPLAMGSQLLRRASVARIGAKGLRNLSLIFDRVPARRPRHPGDSWVSPSSLG